MSSVLRPLIFPFRPGRALLQGCFWPRTLDKLLHSAGKESSPLLAPFSSKSDAKENIVYKPSRPVPTYHLSPSLHPHFSKDLLDVHLHYDYGGHNLDDEPWSYEIWFQSDERVVYEIHGGPMKGRKNHQTPLYQCIRPGELWQISWLEETGTIVTMVYDIPKETINSMVAFSKGHWEHPDRAHGDKRNPQDFERWRSLADIGHQNERCVFVKSAKINMKYRGQGDLTPVEACSMTI